MAETFKLFPSPVRKKFKAHTDFKKCIICQSVTNERLNNVTDASLETLSSVTNARRDFTSHRLRTQIQTKEDFLQKIPKWHRSCRAKWTSKTNILRLEGDASSSTPSSCMMTRQSVPHFDIKQMCVICGRERMTGKLKHEKLRTIESTSVQDMLYTQAVSSNDQRLLLRIRGDGKHKTIDMIAAKARYHKHCYDILRLHRVKREHQNPYDKSFSALLCDVTEPLQTGKVFFSSTLRQMYQTHLSSFGLNAELVAQYRTSSLKQRLRKYFGSSVLFVPRGGQLSDLVCSAQLSVAELVKAVEAHQKDLNENYVRVDCGSEDDDDVKGKVPGDKNEVKAKMAFQVAQNIKSELKDVQKSMKEHGPQSWDITYDKALSMVPPSLYNILAFILSENASFDKADEEGRVPTDKDGPRRNSHMSTHEKVLNLAQDIVFTVTSMQTPQHVGLAVYVYHKTRSRDLITVLNRLGLCISYVELQRLLTTVSNQITDESRDDNTFIPSNILPGRFTQFAIDNLDFSESTLDGSSMHVTSMVMYQPLLQEVVLNRSIGAIPAHIGRDTSLHGKADIDMKVMTKVRKLKRTMHSGNKLNLESLLQQKASEMPNLNLCWIMLRLCPTKFLEVEVDCPGWKVFNAAISNNTIPVTSIGYCPFLQKSPTDPAVVREALLICMKSSRKLGMEHTVVTQDEAVYEISYTLRLQEPDTFPNLILRLGGFHLLMNYLGAVGKLMGGTGLKELFVEGKLLMEGTANKVLSGKAYYQAINAHMRVYEAMSAVWWSAFEDWCLSNNMDVDSITEVGELMHKIKEVMRDDSDIDRDLILQLDDEANNIQKLKGKFDDSRQHFLTHQLWLSYLSMMDTALQFMHAERDGVWSEHLSSTARMLEIIAAADHCKYIKAVVAYLEEMRMLPETAPKVHTEFEIGHFTVKRSTGKFNSIWTDMALECSQNCDAKGRCGQAGLKGVTMKEHTQKKWFSTLPFTAGISSAVKFLVHLDDADTSHHEANAATKRREVDSRERVVKVIVEGDMVNPFTYTGTKDMLNISDGKIASAEISRDLLGAREYGRQSLQHYITTGNTKKLKLHTFDELQKTTKKGQQIKQELTDEMAILKRIVIDKEQGIVGTPLTDLLKHELHRYPPSIAEVDSTTKSVKLRSGNKAVLLSICRKKMGLPKWPVTISATIYKTAIVVDVMGLLRTNKPFDNEIVDKYAARLLETMTKELSCSELHFVADRYDGLHAVQDANGANVSLKFASGCRDRRLESKAEYQVCKGLVIKHWADIIQNSKSKSNLLRCLFDCWSQCSPLLPVGLTLTLAGGFEDRQRVTTLGNLETNPIDLVSNHEEADTRVFLHTAACVHRGCTRVVIRASDTDIVVMAIQFFQKLADEGLRELYIQTKEYFIPIHDVVASFNANETKMLPFLHALSGCDTSSFFFGKGKCSFIKASPKVAADLAHISKQLEQQEDVSDELIEHTLVVATDLLIMVYRDGDFPSLDVLRCHLYARVTDIKSMPPTDDAFRQHVLRAILQTCIWVKAMQPRPSIPDTFKFGWTSTSAGVRPVLMVRSPLPLHLRSKLFCNCKRMCCRNCPCQKKKIMCGHSCSCKGQAATCMRANLDCNESDTLQCIPDAISVEVKETSTEE